MLHSSGKRYRALRHRQHAPRDALERALRPGHGLRGRARDQDLQTGVQVLEGGRLELKSDSYADVHGCKAAPHPPGEVVQKKN